MNPAHSVSVRKESAQLYRLRAEFGARTLPPQPSAEQVQNFERRDGELRDKIQAQELKLTGLKAQRRRTPTKLTLKELPEAERFAQLGFRMGGPIAVALYNGLRRGNAGTGRPKL